LNIDVSLADTIEQDEVLHLYRANGWSSSEKPVQLMAALRNSHALVTARIDRQLVGLGDEERMRRAFVRTLGKPPQAVLREARLRTGYDLPEI